MSLRRSLVRRSARHAGQTRRATGHMRKGQRLWPPWQSLPARRTPSSLPCQRAPLAAMTSLLPALLQPIWYKHPQHACQSQCNASLCEATSCQITFCTLLPQSRVCPCAAVFVKTAYCAGTSWLCHWLGRKTRQAATHTQALPPFWHGSNRHLWEGLHGSLQLWGVTLSRNADSCSFPQQVAHQSERQPIVDAMMGATYADMEWHRTDMAIHRQGSCITHTVSICVKIAILIGLMTMQALGSVSKGVMYSDSSTSLNKSTQVFLLSCRTFFSHCTKPCCDE